MAASDHHPNGYVRWPALVTSVLAATAIGVTALSMSLTAHSDQPHAGAVSQTTYVEDIREIKQDLREMSRKLDALIMRSTQDHGFQPGDE